MDQNQTQTVDNDLQKAIDDITNTTNVDPVFSDPVAAPSSVPEGDTGELGEPVGPFPEPKVQMVTQGPEPIAPLDSINIPDLDVPAPAPNPAPGTMPEPALAPEVNLTPEAPAPETPAPEINTNLNMRQIKESALRDLVPLLDHLNLTPDQKFNIYRDMFENLRDYTVLESAYNAAREIPDEEERAKALLYLIESIDRM